jgi:hypothetical protein
MACLRHPACRMPQRPVNVLPTRRSRPLERTARGNAVGRAAAHRVRGSCRRGWPTSRDAVRRGEGTTGAHRRERDRGGNEQCGKHGARDSCRASEVRTH